jgi:cytosine permease
MKEKSEVVLNDYATGRVPLDQKKSDWDVAVVTAGFCIAMSGLFTGAAMAAGLTFRQALVAAILGNAILTVYGTFLGIAGAREGVSTSMLARHSFGRQGSKIVSLVLALTMLGWFSVQVGFFGTTINAMFPTGGFLTNPRVAGFWGGILMLLTAYFGYKGLSILSKIVIPLLLVTSVIGITAAVNQSGGWSALSVILPESNIGISTGIVIAVGSFAAGASAQADITRYAKSAKSAVVATLFGYMGANLFVIMAGFITTLATGAGDLPNAMLMLGLGFPALIVLIGAQWTTNDNNLYTSSLGLANILKFKKSNIVLVTGVLATLVGVAGLADYFVGWLVILGTGVPPMAGVIVADYYAVKKQKYEFGNGTRYSNWNVWAIVAWAAGGLFGYFVQWGSGSVNSLVISFVLYVVLMKVFNESRYGHIGEHVEKEYALEAEGV